MKNNEFRRLNRRELLELLIAQIEENERLRQQLEDSQKELNDRRIKIANAGSLAEAALLLSDVFQAVDEAASLYLENLGVVTRRESESA